MGLAVIVKSCLVALLLLAMALWQCPCPCPSHDLAPGQASGVCEHLDCSCHIAAEIARHMCSDPDATLTASRTAHTTPPHLLPPVLLAAPVSLRHLWIGPYTTRPGLLPLARSPAAAPPIPPPRA